GLQNTCGFNAQLSRGTGRIGVMHFGVESAPFKSDQNISLESVAQDLHQLCQTIVQNPCHGDFQYADSD
ncbi:MAG: hypothetical protein AB2807_09885, partial [Candidatus Sedimenticola endophacoides]